uniref:Uncharacterized protein n=1 Tax=Timema douglasi TaxID=61478 RepID=A0A7R8VFJ4_TIMDO|nr:unnamed protein product [Timema douglasi]
MRAIGPFHLACKCRAMATNGTSFTAGDKRSDRTIPESWSWNRILVVSVPGPVVYCATGIVHPDFMCIPLCVLPDFSQRSIESKSMIFSKSLRRCSKKPVIGRCFVLKREDPLKLLTLAEEELLREAKRGAARASVSGPLGWVKCPLRPTNKRFLRNTILHTINNNSRRSSKTRKNQDSRNRSVLSSNSKTSVDSTKYQPNKRVEGHEKTNKNKVDKGITPSRCDARGDKNVPESGPLLGAKAEHDLKLSTGCLDGFKQNGIFFKAVCGESGPIDRCTNFKSATADADIVTKAINNNNQAEDGVSGDEEDNTLVVQERLILSVAEAIDHIQ